MGKFKYSANIKYTIEGNSDEKDLNKLKEECDNIVDLFLTDMSDECEFTVDINSNISEVK